MQTQKMKMASNITVCMPHSITVTSRYIIIYTGIWECGVCLATYDKSGDDHDWWVECDRVHLLVSCKMREPKEGPWSKEVVLSCLQET